MKFFHLERNKPFRMIYRYHDPEQEKREERESRIRKEMGIDDGDEEQKRKVYSPNIRGQFRGQRETNREGFFARKETRKSDVRVLVLIAILSIIAYYFLG